VKFKSPIISQGSGKIGGAVYSHNSSGNYIRNWRSPVNSNTAQQQAIRNYLSQLATAWASTLTAAQRLAWEVVGQNMTWINPLGESIKLSGRNWFIKVNTQRLQAGLAVITAAFTVFDLATFTLPVPTVVAAGSSVSMAFTNTDSWAGEVGGAMLVWASRPQNATINFFAGPYRFAGKISGAVSPPTSPSVITLPFVIGPVGSKIFFRVAVVRADGRPSPTFRVVGTA